MTKKAELVAMLNKALELEHAARIQYLAHAELVQGPGSEPIVERLKEIAGDEQKHEGMFRECLAILGAEPSMGMAATHKAKELKDILAVNLKDEKDAVDFYRTISAKLKEAREELKYEYEYIEHRLRHVIMDEQEHAFEITSIQ